MRGKERVLRRGYAFASLFRPRIVESELLLVRLVTRPQVYVKAALFNEKYSILHLTGD
jgi:hypothetical protein